MATTTTTSVTAPTTSTTTVTSVVESWFKTHERLLIVAMVLAVGTFGLGKFYDVEAVRKDAKVVAAQQIAAAAEQNSAALAAQSATTQAQFTALVQNLSAQNAALVASMAQRSVTVTKQQAIDATLPTAELASRWNEVASTLITASGDTLVVSNADAHRTLDLLEQEPVLAQNLTDEKTIAANYLAEVQKSDLLTTNLNAQIVGLKTQITDDQKVCTAQVAAVKAQGHKNSVKWFLRGFGVGFISGLFGGHSGL